MDATPNSNHRRIAAGVKRGIHGRITKALIDPEKRKRMEDMYPSLAGKQLEDYDLLKRTDCLAFGKEILARVK